MRGYRANHHKETYILTTQTNYAGRQNDADASSRPNPELLAAIAEHRAASTEHIAYVTPMSELWGDAVDSDEKCIVIPLPGISASEIDYKDERLYAEVRYRPDGTALECVMMARERIALSGVAVHSTAAEHHGRLYVLWDFDDMWVFSTIGSMLSWREICGSRHELPSVFRLPSVPSYAAASLVC